MPGIIQTILAFIVLLGVLVFLHELGHFLIAKLVGIRVETFSIGFPPRLFGKKIGDTDYCISATPLGGYVKLAGMIDESLDQETIKGEPWEYQSKSVPARMATILAGPLMNIFLTIFLFSALIYIQGEPVVTGSGIGFVQEDYPAAQAGIQVGDRIISIDGSPINKWEQMTSIIHSKPETDILVEWKRGDEILSAVIQTRKEKIPINDEIQEVGLIGISPEFTMQEVSVMASVNYGFDRTVRLTKLLYHSIKSLFAGKESLRSLGGPLVIAKIAGDTARSGWDTFLTFMAFLSLNLAIINLLPIPALDGGHLLFLSVEGIIRRPLPLKVRIGFQKIGMVFLLTLILFIVFNDVRNLFF